MNIFSPGTSTVSHPLIVWEYSQCKLVSFSFSFFVSKLKNLINESSCTLLTL